MTFAIGMWRRPQRIRSQWISVQIYVQGYGIPSQLVQMIPYIVTLLVLAFGVKNIQPPAGVGKYEDE